MINWTNKDKKYAISLIENNLKKSYKECNDPIQRFGYYELFTIIEKEILRFDNSKLDALKDCNPIFMHFTYGLYLRNTYNLSNSFICRTADGASITIIKFLKKYINEIDEIIRSSNQD